MLNDGIAFRIQMDDSPFRQAFAQCSRDGIDDILDISNRCAFTDIHQNCPTE